MPSGGARRGAGRPAKADSERKVRLTIRITPKHGAMLNEVARLSGMSVGQVVCEMLDRMPGGSKHNETLGS